VIGRVLLETRDAEKAWQAYRKYVVETGNYARVDVLPPERGSSGFRYAVVAYDEPCRLDRYMPGITHMDLRALAKTYLRVTKLKMEAERLAGFVESETVRAILEKSAEEKGALKREIEALVSRHPVYQWCRRIKSGRGRMGAVDALMFLGFIDPHECTSGGRAKKYWGLTPEGRRRAGRKAAGKPELKGVAYMMASRIVMAKDEYYYPFYQAKREYLLSKYPERIPVDLGGRVVEFERGKPGYMAVINGKALFWLMGLIVSHAQQVIREAEGYEVPKHSFHIPPKPDEYAEPPEELLEAVRRGLAARR